MTSHASYRPVPAHIDLPALEREILDLWAEQGTFAASLDTPHDAPRWTFYEGPPTANGTPGTHHVEARVFKDIFPRFKTMQGYHVDRKAGWDCHGLPVEIAVEKELGFNGKPDIEAYGIAEFNARCREAVVRNVDLFEEMTDRMGYWVDMAHPYRTMEPSYVESVWWALSTIFDKGLLTEDFRVAPYCPRCGTTLSDHELAQGYETITDASVYVRFPLTSGPYAGKASMLVWTTTPWTLVSNTAVAVNPDVTYVLASDGQETLVVAEPLLAKALGEGFTSTGESFSGRDMERWTYQRPFDFVTFPGGDDGQGASEAHFVVLADYVTTEDGTGLVHQSPAFGADDMAVSKAYGLPIVNPITADGHFEADVPLVGGMFFKTADRVLADDLTARGLMFHELAYEHSYPHCWRCHTPLMYYALPAWYIRTTAVKDQLLAENAGTNWFPETIKNGRYGDWLNNNIDWSLSRSRYWGTPLPIWRNDVDPTLLVCVDSLSRLSELTGRDLADLDPHRPYIDDVTFEIEDTPGTYRRVPDVIDAWFDSGSMPFAQWGYPHVPGSKEKFEQAYPAQYICEAIDQTRGWFYSLMAVGTLVFDQSSYENVVCLGHILAEDGRKMSKHLGNILLPMPLMDEHGADALRWFMACSGSPWSARRIGHGALSEIVRKVLLTYWNTTAFHVLYAGAAGEGWSPTTGDVPPVAEREVLDQWLLSELHTLTRDVTTALESFDTQTAGARIAGFVDDMSNWYVRRSRRRFWRGDTAALATLHETLDVLTRLLAPLTPFIAERVWQDVIRPVTVDAPASVHLATWPVTDESLIVEGLGARVDLARRVTELGRAARAEAKVRTRQPLRRALVASGAWQQLGEDLRAQVCEELNVGTLESLANAGGALVDHSAKGNFRNLGKRFGKETPLVAAAIAAADATDLAAALGAHGAASMQVNGSTVEVGPDDVIISERPREGWSVVNDQGETVALDLELDDDLRRAGFAREAIRVIQEARKSSGLDISDRITLSWSAAGPIADALRGHESEIADEVLATSITASEGAVTGEGTFSDEELGFAFTLSKA
ncbi:isoleucine--tRNA ligase [Aeromicrobium sp.]|uniref:isoleucine--tRNA ligase n=1 Tax=Aeromicrobium sp. TaxID=1871063 RepID=UPI0019A8A05E|nr:isoleucine--tRNA ligase [Aeromicrobium sp.]MBC7632634.1 isoleucine--tRNA ligase [Aeromicrobium sp.]